MNHTDASGKKIEQPRIGYVPQNLVFDRSTPVTVADMLCANTSGFPVWLGHKKEKLVHAEKLLNKVGANASLLPKRLGSLSGGEMQRIAIARAVLKNAPIIILDEATAFADPDNEVKVQTAFAKLSEGKTVIMIAHRLSTVRNADCIYVIADGKIAEYGNRAELIEKKGMFYKMQNDYQSSVSWKVSNETEESRND